MARAVALLVGAWLSLSASGASAQSLFGVSLGDSEATALETMGGSAKSSPIRGRSGQGLIADGQRAAMVCNGKIVSVQETIGSGLHDFAGAAAVVEAREGPGQLRLLNDRTSRGEYSGVELTWAQQYGSLQVSYWQLRDGEPEVVRRLSGPNPCAD
jgi:hypothetical protein